MTGTEAFRCLQFPVLASILLTFADQLIDEFLGAADRTIAVAMSADLFLGVAWVEPPARASP